MASYFVLDGDQVNVALSTSGDSTGASDSFIYFTNPESGKAAVQKDTAGKKCIKVPDDNGDSWTVDTIGKELDGAFLYLEVAGAVDWRDVTNRLKAAGQNQKRVALEAK